MEMLLLLLVLLCAVLFWRIHCCRQECGMTHSGVEGLAECLILETAAVAGDFLESGQVVSVLSGGKYQGTISVRCQPAEGGRMGYTVCMYGSGDLGQAFDAFCRENPSAVSREPEAFGKLENFVGKYAGCYDRERDSLIYHTSQTAVMDQEQLREVELALYRRLSSHPLADMESNSLIHTRYVGNHK